MAEPDTSDIHETGEEDWFKEARLRHDEVLDEGRAAEAMLWRASSLLCIIVGGAAICGGLALWLW